MLGGLQALEQILEGSVPLDGRRIALGKIFFFFFVEAMTDAALRQEVESYLVGWRKSVARAIRQAQEAGDIPADVNRKALAIDLVGLVDGVSMHALIDGAVMTHLREQSPVRFWIRRLTAPAGTAASSIAAAE
jgi:hypothetical protein